MEVVFEGSKTFWKTKNVINVMMIMHSLWDVVEIIAYDPVIDREAPRLYVKRSDTVPQQANASTMSALYASFHPNQTKDAERKATSSFLFNHLMIDEYLPVTRVFTIAVRSSFPEEKRSEVAGQVLGCAKPPGLVPYPSPFYSPLRSPKASLPSTPRTLTAPAVKLSARERLRLPIIFGKVTKGKTLSKADEHTWIMFSKNKSSDELLANVATALAVRMPDEAAMLKRAAHSLTLPENCPFPERSSGSSSPTNRARAEEKGMGVDITSAGDSLLTAADTSPAVTPNNASRSARLRRRGSRSDTADSNPSSPTAVSAKRTRSLGAGSKSTDTDDSFGTTAGSAHSSVRLDQPHNAALDVVNAQDTDDIAQQRAGSGMFSSLMHSLTANFAAMSFRRSPPASSKVDSKVDRSMNILRAKSADEAEADPRPKCVTDAVEEVVPTRLPSASASCSDLNAVRAKPKPSLGVGTMVGGWVGWGRRAAGSPYRVSPVPFAFEDAEGEPLAQPN